MHGILRTVLAGAHQADHTRVSVSWTHCLRVAACGAQVHVGPEGAVCGGERRGHHHLHHDLLQRPPQRGEPEGELPRQVALQAHMEGLEAGSHTF